MTLASTTGLQAAHQLTPGPAGGRSGAATPGLLRNSSRSSLLLEFFNVETTVRAANEYSAGVEVDLARDYKTGNETRAGFLQRSIPEFEELKYF